MKVNDFGSHEPVLHRTDPTHNPAGHRIDPKVKMLQKKIEGLKRQNEKMRTALTYIERECTQYAGVNSKNVLTFAQEGLSVV